MSLHAADAAGPDSEPDNSNSDDSNSEHSSDSDTDTDSEEDELTAAEQHQCSACSRIFFSAYRLSRHEGSNSCRPKPTSHAVACEAVRALERLIQCNEVE